MTSDGSSELIKKEKNMRNPNNYFVRIYHNSREEKYNENMRVEMTDQSY